MVGLDGVTYPSMYVGGEVRIVTNDLSYTGTINFDVKTDIKERALIQFVSPGVQKLQGVFGRDPLSAKATKAEFRAVDGGIDFKKLITFGSNPDATSQYDLSQVTINVRSADNTYNQNHNFNTVGDLSLTGLIPMKYYVKEVAAPAGLELLTTVFEITVKAGETIPFTITNVERTGALEIIKSTTTNARKHDFTKVKVNVRSLESHITYNKDFFLNANGRLVINNLPEGKYEVTELAVPPTMQLTALPQTVTVTKGTRPTVASTAKMVNDETMIAVKITKTITNPTPFPFTIDYTKIKIRIRSLIPEVVYDKTLPLQADGTLLVSGLAYGEYEVTEVECPWYMTRDTTVHKIIANTHGKTYPVTFNNILETGAMKLIKKVNKTTTTDASIIHDLTKVKVRVETTETHFIYNNEFYLQADGTLVLTNLPVGKYKITEVEVPPTMQLTALPRVVTVTAGTQPTLASTTTLTNDETKVHIHIKKTITNPTTVAPNAIDYTKISIRIRSLVANVTYDKIFALNQDGELLIKNLPYGKYEVTEVAVPDYMDKDTTVHTIVADTHNKTYEAPFNNLLIPADVNITKRNSEGGTMPGFTFGIYQDIERFSDGTPKVYKINRTTNEFATTPEPQGTQANHLRDLYTKGDETKRILGDIITGAAGTVTTLTMPYQFKNVYVQELRNTPSAYVNMDYMPKLVKLNPHSTAYVEFTNIIKERGQVKINKDDEDGNYVEWYFDLYRQSPGETEKVYVETIATSKLTGIGYSTIIDLLDPLGQKVTFFIKEQPHTLYVTDGNYIELTPAMYDSNTSIFTLNLTNKFKEIRYTHGKIAEQNPYGLVADGATFEIFDNVSETIYATGTAVRGQVFYSAIRVDKILNNENLYYRETSAPAGFELDMMSYKIPTLTETFLETYVSGIPVALRPTTEPLINKLKPVELGTSASFVDGGKTIPVGQEEVTLIDIVSYKNLIPNKEYEIRGVLMDKRLDPIAPLLVDNQAVESRIKFTPLTANGTVEVAFTFNTLGMDETFDIVVYEYLTYNQNPIEEHTDPDDIEQTVTVVKPEPLAETGIQTKERLLVSAIIALISTIALLVLVVANHKRQEESV